MRSVPHQRTGDLLPCLAGLALLLASCSSERVAESSLAAGGARPEPERIIRLLAAETRPLEAVERLKARVETDIGMRVEITRRARTQQVIAEIDQELASKHNTYDLVLVPHSALGRLVAGGYVRSLESYPTGVTSVEGRFVPDRDLFPGWWRATSWYRGKPYGYPFLARAMSLWYRSDLSDEEEADAFYRKYRHPMNASSTWDEYEHLAEFLHRPESRRYGTVVLGASEGTLAHHWTQFALSYGAKILDAERPDEYGDIVVNSPAAVKATEFYLKLLRLSPPDSAKYTAQDALRAFQEGRAATGVMWHDQAPRVDDVRESQFPGRFGYGGVPSATGTRAVLFETDLFVIPESAPHPREAFDFMQWALTHEVQSALISNGGFSARPSVYEDPATRRMLPLHIWIFPDLITGAVPTMMIPEADQIEQTMSRELSRIIQNEIPPKAGLDRIAQRLQQLLAGKAKLRFPTP